MSAFLTDFIYAICAATFISFVFDALMVEGKIKKYCGVAVSILVIALIVTPVVNLFTNGGFELNPEQFELETNYENIELKDYKDFLSEVYKRNN